jgi:membrane protease YdiL (CAAX protease family)
LSQMSLLLTLSEWLGVAAIMLLLGSRLHPHPVKFRYPRREGLISLSLYGLILVIAVYMYTSGGFVNLLALISPQRQLYPRLVLALVCLMPFALALAARRQPLRSAGWNRTGLGMALRLTVALVFLTIFLRGKIYALLNGITADEGLTLLIWIGISLAEESIFRGYLQLRLADWVGPRYGWILTALLYTLWQIPRLMSEPSMLLLNLGLALGQGLVLGWVMHKSGHVLAPALYRAVSEWLFLVS